MEWNGKTYVLYHRACPDGYGAAFAAWLRLGDAATYLACAYDDAETPDIAAGSKIYIVDFSFKRSVLEFMHEHAFDLRVIDHHKTAQENLAGLPYAHFDMTKSGAVLTWEFFHPEAPHDCPDFFKYIQDRDLWTWALPRSQEFSAALSSYPKNFQVWLELYNRFCANRDEFFDEGRHILRKQDKDVTYLVDNAAFFCTIEDHRFPVVNTSLLGSEVCNGLLQRYPDAPFAGCYHDLPDGRRKWSLRARKDGFDVTTVAKLFGGGGHQAAAAFTMHLGLHRVGDPAIVYCVP